MIVAGDDGKVKDYGKKFLYQSDQDAGTDAAQRDRPLHPQACEKRKRAGYETPLLRRGTGDSHCRWSQT